MYFKSVHKLTEWFIYEYRIDLIWVMDKFRQIKKLGNLALNYKTKDFNKVHGSDKVIFNFLLDISFVSA